MRTYTLALASVLLVGATLLLGCGSEVEEFADLPDEVDFNLHIKPILSDRCFKCHGPDANKREAELRLDLEEGAFHLRLESGGYAIIPGSPRRSTVMRRITSTDPDEQMPPPESNLALTPREIALIRKWIDQGAKWKPHWAFIPPVRPALPEVEQADWPANEIDRFVLKELEARDLAPSPPADRETLLRRVSLDLTGLPPSVEEIDAFLADTSPQAYERAVDRLLASPHYGERLAVEWLDVARYADSHGYQDDGMRTMWPWRDWVIGAFNENMPYDRFVTWQMAGDLLPNPTRDQLLATGFHRNHMQSQEGGIVLEEYRVEYVADRTQTTAKAFLGLTMECARCHDHKYDPFSQKDYFRLFAFFNNINEVGNIPYAGEASPTVTLPEPEVEEQLAELNRQMEELSVRAEISSPDYDAGYDRWLADLAAGRADRTVRPAGLVGAYPLDGMTADKKFRNTAAPSRPATLTGDQELPPEATEGRVDGGLLLNGQSFVDAGQEIGKFERNQVFSVGLWIKPLEAGIEGPLFSRTSGLFDGNRGYVCHLNADGTISASLNHVLPDNSIEVRTRETVKPGEWTHVVLTYDGSSRASGVHLFLNGEEAPVETLVDNLHHSMLYTKHVVTGERTNWGGEGSLRIGYMGPNQTKLDSVVVDDLRVYNRRLTAIEVASLNGATDMLASLASIPESGRTPAQKTALRDYYVTRLSTAWPAAFARLAEVRGRENELMTMQTQVMILKERQEVRPSFVLARGSYDAPTDPVDRGTPEVLSVYPDDLPKDRLGLARWLTDPQNPLPARVTVNRYWQMIFGRGLVATPEDFGNQGALPSHPELLDWLAVDFVASGWDVKRLLKQMVLSSTYRQSSIATGASREMDPDNRWLGRGPAVRLSAEGLRDLALAASGLLVREIGGPPVRPYQPEGLWEALATRNETKYVQDHGDKLYRRSLYTIWKRSSPPPSMISFDAAERNFCTVRRQRTNTPLQALVVMNDPQFVEASRILAERVMREAGESLDDRLTLAFRLLTGRKPSAAELGRLRSLYADQLASFQADRTGARELLSVGERRADPKLDAPSLAALTMGVSTILNFDATVFKR